MRVNCTGTIYRYAAGGSLSYLCSKADTFTTVATPFLLIHKRDGGGSINGVTAAKGTGQVFLNVATLSTATTCAAAALCISKCSGGTVAENPTTALKASELNFADVDPAQFQAVINGGLANAAVGVTASPVATQIFGVAVNTSLRNAMQNAMIRNGLLTGCVRRHSETEACMPNLTTAQVSTIFANNGFTDWNNVAFSKTDSVQATGYLFPSAATDPGNTNIHICARTAGSGTWATMNIKFENAPCNGSLSQAYTTSTSQLLGNETNAQANGQEKIVHAMSGSGDVESCLAGLNTGAASGTFTPYPTVLNSAVVAPGTSNARWAIGVLGVERNASGSLPYRFVKIDGFAPNAQNVVEGKYRFWAELVNVVGTTPTTDQLAIALLKSLSSPISIASLNVTQTWGGITGFLGEATNPDTTLQPTNFAPATNGSATLLNAAFDSVRPVNPFTHQTPAGADLNHCRVPTIPAGTRVLPAY